MYRLLLVFLGGGAGSVLRYLVQEWFARGTASAFPLGTFFVNITGCFLIGLLGGAFLGYRPVGEDYRIAILTGLLGGYTTFSAFGWETMQLAAGRQLTLAGLNVLASVTCGLLAVFLGRQLAHALFG